ncbi:MAG TPA: cytochrome P450, partial [Mycobacterium sp.]|nr:cytochrome P450 [Mycobacterium sp.]
MSVLPPAPRNPLPYRTQLRSLRAFHTGFETLRDAGGPVTRVVLGPRWLVPPLVVVTSPRGGHDMIGRTDAFVDKALIHREVRNVLGGNLFTLPHDEWLPRRRTVQHVFTKQHVREFGGHMAQAAQNSCDGWADGAVIDLDRQCRLLTLRALGRSVLGIDLDQRSDAIAGPLQVTLSYSADRALRPWRRMTAKQRGE